MKHLPKSLFNKGQTLVEILVAMGLSAILIPSILTLTVASREARAQEGQRLMSATLLREAKEAVRSIRESSWASIAFDGTYHPEISGSSWALVPGTEDIGNFHRQIEIQPVRRDQSGAIVESGGFVDPSTKKITHSVSWDEPRSGSVSAMEYLTRFLGNDTRVHTTQADFDAGVKVNTISTNTGGGTIELAPSVGSLSFTDDYTASSDYTFDPNKIEVANGFAQLREQGTQVSGSTTNSDFTSNLSGWIFGTFGQDVNQSASRRRTGGNPGGYVQINFPKDRNVVAGGFLYQAFTTSAANPTATLSFQWTVTRYQATPDSFRLLAFVDSSASPPNLAEAVWDSGAITSTTAWSSTVTLDVSSRLGAAGTYYVKIAAVVDYPTTSRGPYTVGFDNVLLTWSGIGNATFATDSPSIYPNNSFTAAPVVSWDSFTATEELNGGTIGYQLSDDDGTTWKYFRNTLDGWVEALSPTDYNGASTVDANITSFPIANNSIRVRAFLISDGTQLVRLDRIVIGFTGTIDANEGTFTSGTIDTGSVVSFNSILWTESNTPNTSIRFQIATNADNTTWQFAGPDGTNASYFTGGSGTIPLSAALAQYLKYQITFSSTTSDIPVVSDFTVNFSP